MSLKRIGLLSAALLGMASLDSVATHRRIRRSLEEYSRTPSWEGGPSPLGSCMEPSRIALQELQRSWTFRLLAP